MLKDCSSQVEVTANSSTIGGREDLQQRLTTCEHSLKDLLDALQLVQQKTSLTDDLSHLSDEVAEWITQSKARLVDCATPCNTETEIDSKLAELEVRTSI